MKISLIIPAYNEEKYIGACLESVQKHGSGLFEVIVVSNGSTDKTTEIVKSFAFAKLINEPEKSLPHARNRALTEAGGDLLAYIDSDCRLRAGWFETVSNLFNEKKNVVCFSGPYRYYDLKGIKNFFAQLGWWLSAPISYRLVGYSLLAGNFVVKRNVFESVGGFNPNVTFYGDDMDLARRLSQYGKVVFDMDFFVFSSARRLIEAGILRTFFVYGLNFIWEVIFRRPFSKKYQYERTWKN